jgi:hypothetical protein
VSPCVRGRRLRRRWPGVSAGLSLGRPARRFAEPRPRRPLARILAAGTARKQLSGEEFHGHDHELPTFARWIPSSATPDLLVTSLGTGLFAWLC